MIKNPQLKDRYKLSINLNSELYPDDLVLCSLTDVKFDDITNATSKVDIDFYKKELNTEIRETLDGDIAKSLEILKTMKFGINLAAYKGNRQSGFGYQFDFIEMVCHKTGFSYNEAGIVVHEVVWKFDKYKVV